MINILFNNPSSLIANILVLGHATMAYQDRYDIHYISTARRICFKALADHLKGDALECLDQCRTRSSGVGLRL